MKEYLRIYLQRAHNEHPLREDGGPDEHAALQPALPARELPGQPRGQYIGPGAISTPSSHPRNVIFPLPRNAR